MKVSSKARGANAGREGTSVLTSSKSDEPTPAAGLVSCDGSIIDEIVRDGARRMLAAALEAEVAAHVEEVEGNGRRLVVRNGHAVPRRGC